MAPLLNYRNWHNFQKILARATQACKANNQAASNHFIKTTKMVILGSEAQQKLKNVHLSHYAYYLIVQNGNPAKPVIAARQTYFTIQTQRQKLANNKAFKQLHKNKKHLFLKNKLKEHNKQLVKAAQQAREATTINFAIFQNHGYQKLYSKLDQKAIHQQKRLKKNQKILNHIDSTKLAANLFQATQTKKKLKQNSINSKQQANTTHFDIGHKVKQTIQKLGKTMPKKLPTPQVSIKQLKNNIKITKKK